MRLSITEIKDIFPDHKGALDSEITIHEVYTDSRKQTNKGIFIPIVGDHFDGHDFLKSAINNGAIAALWKKERQIPAYVPTDFPMFFVNDTLNGLQTLASVYLERTKPIVIGITGSNGKTTTKDLLSAVLEMKYKTFKTQGNLNNHIGVPLTILAMPEDTEVLIVEMGMSDFGEISLLTNLANPHHAIITNIGESHIEFLGSREGIAKAKLEIVDGMRPGGKLFVDGDEPLLRGIGIDKDISIIHCGFGLKNDIVISNVSTDSDGLNFVVNDFGFALSLLGEHNAKNASFAIMVGLELGLSYDQIKEALATIEITGMRLQRVRGKNQSLIINDAYNSSPTSMKAAIETLKGIGSYERKVLVLGDSYELGSNEEELHRSVAAVIEPPITDLICIGEKGNWIADEVRKKSTNIPVYSFMRKEEALPFISEFLAPNTVLLFKASRGAKLESLIHQLIETNP